MTLTEFNKIYYDVAKPGNEVLRDYETIGGRWTVDTWKKGDWTAQLMDEGYTAVLFNDKDPGKRYVRDYNDNIETHGE